MSIRCNGAPRCDEQDDVRICLPADFRQGIASWFAVGKIVFLVNSDKVGVNGTILVIRICVSGCIVKGERHSGFRLPIIDGDFDTLYDLCDDI